MEVMRELQLKHVYTVYLYIYIVKVHLTLNNVYIFVCA